MVNPTENQDMLFRALQKQFEAQIEIHQYNVINLVTQGIGVAEHPGITETVEEELAKMAEYYDKLEMLGRVQQKADDLR